MAPEMEGVLQGEWRKSATLPFMNFDPLGPLHAQPRLVTFMTDFGLRDPSAGVLSGVGLGITKPARVT